MCASRNAALSESGFLAPEQHMIAHQAVGPDVDSILGGVGGVFLEKGKVMLAVFDFEKDITPPILGDVVRQSRNHDSGTPSHWGHELSKAVVGSYDEFRSLSPISPEWGTSNH